MPIQGILLQDLIGHRVKCIKMMYDVFDSTGKVDEQARAMTGVEGVVKSVDGIGQIHVKWDNGSSLALNSQVDEFELLD